MVTIAVRIVVVGFVDAVRVMLALSEPEEMPGNNQFSLQFIVQLVLEYMLKVDLLFAVSATVKSVEETFKEAAPDA
jgi:hypothetical protein